MPQYDFCCDVCGFTIGIIAPISKAPKTYGCEICGIEMYRVYTFATGNKEYGTPLVSHSMAIHPEQIPEHNKLFPDVEVRDDGCPVFQNYQQHKNYLEKMGWEKRPKKSKKVNTSG